MAEATSENTFTIGEMVEHLRARWPEVTPSMVRFWEREGLLTPARTDGGHRKYCAGDLERLRMVAELRQRRYLPLEAVKHILHQMDADPTYDISLYDEIFRPDEYDPAFQPVTRAEATKRTGLTVEQIEAFEQSGFLPTWGKSGRQRRFDEDDLRILQMLAELLQAGFAPEALAFYAADTREHVRHETQFLAQALGGCERPPERRAVYRQVQQAVSELRKLLYRKYGRQAIGELLEGS
ncbi:MAG: MerR family transcriptional regulator [Chloroflexota bacterium]